MPEISVIVSTYNQPAWLEKVLHGYLEQDHPDFELLVADDGSGEETTRVVERVREKASFPIRHLWHDVAGYERSTILNQAVLRADGDYLVFSDGDCVPRRDFVAAHHRLRKPGRFLSGGMVRLDRDASEALTLEEIRSGLCFRVSWFRPRGGVRPPRHVLRLLEPGPLATMLDWLTPTKATFNLNNSSLWKEMVLELNGFEREMRYGGADRAFGDRLRNAGVRGVQVRFRAVLLHLAHDRPYATRESRERNARIRERIQREGEIRAIEGIAEVDPARAGAPPWSSIETGGSDGG